MYNPYILEAIISKSILREVLNALAISNSFVVGLLFLMTLGSRVAVGIKFQFPFP